jgi:hypothetical protein
MHQVLAYLSDVRVTSLTGDDAGSFRLTFTFSENPFFSNKVWGGRLCLTLDVRCLRVGVRSRVHRRRPREAAQATG